MQDGGKKHPKEPWFLIRIFKHTQKIDLGCRPEQDGKAGEGSLLRQKGRGKQANICLTLTGTSLLLLPACKQKLQLQQLAGDASQEGGSWPVPPAPISIFIPVS